MDLFQNTTLLHKIRREFQKIYASVRSPVSVDNSVLSPSPPGTEMNSQNIPQLQEPHRTIDLPSGM